jgi:hypothetical protein
MTAGLRPRAQTELIEYQGGAGEGKMTRFVEVQEEMLRAHP